MRTFLMIWVGQVFSLLGSELVQFALIWHLTMETGSATALTVAMVFQMLPAILVGPFAGVLIDRWNRRWTMVGADGLVALSTLALAALFAAGLAETWHIYAILLLRATGQVFHRPAMSATTPLMVPEEHLTRISGFNQALQRGVMLISAPIGALLLGLMPMQSILAIDIVTALIAIAPLLVVAIPQPPRRAADPVEEGMLKEMSAGFRYLWGWKGLLILILLVTFNNVVVSPAFSLLPLLVSEYFSKGALELGWMEAAFSAGAILGGVGLGVWGGFKRRITTALLAFSLTGVPMLVIGFLPPTGYLAAVGAMFAAALVVPAINGSFEAIFQSSVAQEMQGRVSTLITSLAWALIPLGMLAAGPVADVMGVQIWFIIGGAACLLTGLAGALIRSVREIEADAKQTAAAPVEAPGVGIPAVETAG